MDGATPLMLRKEVLLIPVRELEQEVRARLRCEDDDVAVSLPASRIASSIVDGASAALLERFRRPCSILEAVILFSRERGLDPEAVLDDVHPILQQLLDRRVLVRADEPEQAPEATLRPGDRIEERRVAALLYFMEDTEIHLLHGPDGWTALKIQRSVDPESAARLDCEAGVLGHLGGEIGPALLAKGILDGRRYLVLEWCRGLDAATAAEGLRAGAQNAAAGDLLDLCRRIADRYARLHEAGVLHGDVHPRNVLVDRDGTVRLLDFGLSRRLGPSSGGVPRGGVPFFFDPQHARALLDDEPPPPLTAAAEQYSLAVLLYHLVTGAYPAEFSLERMAMLREIASEPPLPFVRRGMPPWPDLEEALARALHKELQGRFGSIAEFARALATIRAPARPAPSVVPSGTRSAAADCLKEALDLAALDGPWLSNGIEAAPTASITFGAAGVAYALLRVSCLRDDPRLLALADVWGCRAGRLGGRGDGFYNLAIEITPERVGEAAVYHTESGVHAVQAMIARALGDPLTQGEAVAAFLESSGRRAPGLDLTLGRAGRLLACSLLLDGLDEAASGVRASVLEAGRRTLHDIWSELCEEPPITESRINTLGIAHGWAGLLYATLSWSVATGDTVPPPLEGRLAELVELALPSGRGIRWPWKHGGAAQGPGDTMPGWCNGSAGYVLLCGLARDVLGDDRYLEPAVGAAWDAWDGPDVSGSLCCGLVGRAYALLQAYHQTGESEWLRRARELAERAAGRGSFDPVYAHSLYKGRLGLAVLAADLERPDQAALPFFQRERRCSR